MTLAINDNIKILENLKQAFERTISWGKYRSKITTQLKSNDLDYMIDPTFRNINKLFVQLFKAGENDPTRNSFVKYYVSLVEIEDFNAAVGNKPFYDEPLKKQKSIWKTCRIVKNNDYTTGNLRDYLYPQNYYKVIDIDFSRQKIQLVLSKSTS